ncbi:MAG: hypothetical protein F6K40_19715 [Okeania sp. SIO3I5]|uniref:hypothetical protein n=1 Tax=Okeania sp. SIO3I5 TaxID=2607805 RepID=UPI0013B9F46A|nr:hypothetical protein [Okeania sp. SIO3I5]NEQ38371.1 hypothetical protein [Okeania sp. SIO3I5]
MKRLLFNSNKSKIPPSSRSASANEKTISLSAIKGKFHHLSRSASRNEKTIVQ